MPSKTQTVISAKTQMVRTIRNDILIKPAFVKMSAAATKFDPTDNQRDCSGT
jgi:hypothetical protein